MVPFVALARWRARCLGSIGEGQTQGLVVVAHASGARERLARRAPCAAGAAVWSRVDPRARPAPPSSRGGAAGKARPLVRLGGCCPLKRSLQCGKGGERGGGALSGLYLSFLFPSLLLAVVLKVALELIPVVFPSRLLAVVLKVGLEVALEVAL